MIFFIETSRLCILVSFLLLVYAPPAFTSSPVTTVTEGNIYGYNIVTNDLEQQCRHGHSTYPSRLADIHSRVNSVIFPASTRNISSNGVLTLLDNQSADIYAYELGNWYTESFEVPTIPCSS